MPTRVNALWPARTRAYPYEPLQRRKSRRRARGEDHMRFIRHAGAAALFIGLLGAPAHAQVSRLPMEVQQVLATLGSKWGTALRENIDATAAAFRPLLKAAPKDGVIVGKNLAYGEDAKQ